MNIFSDSPEETFQLGVKLGEQLPESSVICLFGDLAAGKTTLVKGIVVGAAGCAPDEVVSPTFVIMNSYEGPKPVYHFDLYRLKGAEEFFQMGFDEYWDLSGLTCMEWSERIEEYLPKHAIKITLKADGENRRLITIEGKGLSAKN